MDLDLYPTSQPLCVCIPITYLGVQQRSVGVLPCIIFYIIVYYVHYCIVRAWPQVLQLEADKVADAFRLIVRSRAPPLTVTELLMELHHVNTGENIVPIKASMQALNIIFAMREQFDAKVYGIVIQSLVEEPGPLPTLFMRTVIQVVWRSGLVHVQ